MSWARLDDNFHSHPRTLLAGLAANGLFCRGLSYCAHYLTDGFIPSTWAEQQGGKRPITKLLNAGVWAPVEDGFMVVGYLERNPSRAKVEAERRRERAKKAGGKPSASPGESPGEHPDDFNGSSLGESRRPHTHTPSEGQT